MNHEVRPGLEVLLDEQLSLIRGTSVGLVTNPTGVDPRLRSAVDLLAQQPGVTLSALFGPEHGLGGSAPAGEAVDHAVHPRLGIPVQSLYGVTGGFGPGVLSDLDVLLFDMQDAGCRYFTYAGTLLQIMQAAAAANVRLLVLDRPNPVTGVVVQGPVLETGLRSLVGAHEVPVRHGMTLGELARMMRARHVNDDGTLGIDADLDVVEMQGWRRRSWYDETGLLWVPPSPNMPTLGTATVYPGTCLFEGTNVSEGRGTPLPFEVVGAPWADGERVADEVNGRGLPGVILRPTTFIPTTSKHAGKPCSGVQVHVTDRTLFRPVWTGVELVAAFQRLWPDEFRWLRDSDGQYVFDRLSGTRGLRLGLEEGKTFQELAGEWAAGQRTFEAERREYLLYGGE